MATLYSTFTQPSDAAGAPLAGALLYFYTAGTTTPITVYQDSAAATPHTNPVVADASGIFAPIYVASTPYKTVLKTAAGITVQTVDNIGSSTILTSPQIYDASLTDRYIIVGSELTANRNATLPVLAADDTFTFNNTTGTLKNKSLEDSTTFIVDNADNTKKLAIDVGGITTATTRTYTAPDVSGTVALEGAGVTTVASATTTDIGASKTRDVSITGTTTITGLGTVAAGTYRQGSFTGALTLTYNATSLIVPGAASITTAAGDRFGATSLGSGNWRVEWYVKADGTAVVAAAAGGMTLLSSGTPTAAASTYAVTGLATTYNQFLVVVEGVTNGSASGATINISSDNGGTYDTAVTFTTAAQTTQNGVVTIYSVGATAVKMVAGLGNTPTAVIAGQFATKTGPTNALRLAVGAGTFSGAGTVKIYGVK